MAYLEDPKSKIKYREGTFDLGIIQERVYYSPLNFEKSDIVLDIGGNIGCFSHLALSSGVSHCTAVEPDPSNFALMLTNLEEWRQISRIEVLKRAVMPSGAPEEIPFYINQEGTNKALHSSVPVRGRPTIMVKTISYEELIERRPYTCMKIDIEGAEYDLPIWILPVTLKKLAIELHLTKPAWKAKAHEWDQHIQNFGFKPIKPLEFTPKTRAKLMIYHRESA